MRVLHSLNQRPLLSPEDRRGERHSYPRLKERRKQKRRERERVRRRKMSKVNRMEMRRYPLMQLRRVRKMG